MTDPPRGEKLVSALPLLVSDGRGEGVALPPVGTPLAEGLPETRPLGEAPWLTIGEPDTEALGVAATLLPLPLLEGSGEKEVLALILGELLLEALRLLLTEATGEAVADVERVGDCEAFVKGAEGEGVVVPDVPALIVG